MERCEGRTMKMWDSRFLAIPRRMLDDERYMASLGYGVDPGWGAVASELVRVARCLAAGDEWVDEGTVAFAKEVAAVMKRDRRFKVRRVSGNRIDFVHSPNLLVSVPLVLTMAEFGRPPSSESVNGTIFSENVANFRISGGTTRRRDPEEFWGSAKGLLEDILNEAGV